MEDLIARLYPFGEQKGGHAHGAVADPANKSFLAAEKHWPDLPERGSLESTAPLDDDNITVAHDVHYGPALQLTFSHGPKAGPGFVLGRDPNSCDIVLPNLPRISRRHCYLTFDHERRLIERDCSTHGTVVEYDGKGGEKRCHFTWIIGGQKEPDETKEIVLQLDTSLSLRIVVSKPSFPDRYLANVDKFLQETDTSAGLPFDALDI